MPGTKLFCSVQHTHSPELNAAAHFELHGAAHDVDALVPADDGFAVSFDVQVGCRVAGDLKEDTILISASLMSFQTQQHCARVQLFSEATVAHAPALWTPF